MKSTPFRVAAAVAGLVAACSSPAGGAVAPGSPAPAFALTSSAGDSFELARALRDGPVVVVFFRGTW